MQTANAQRRAIRPAQAAQKLGIGLSTLWRRVKTAPNFPQPFKHGPRTTVFFEDQLDEWLNVCAANSSQFAS